MGGLALAVAVAGCGVVATAPTDSDTARTAAVATSVSATSAPAPSAAATAALALLDDLQVDADDDAPYDRDAYGQRWADTDGNGCNQRDDVLLRDAVAGTTTTAVQGSCSHDVLAGKWLDPYTGQLLTLDDLKDGQQAQAITIDHVVPLAEAHRSGAHTWSTGEREQFANDTRNLLAVSGTVNSTKSDADPGSWLPPLPAARCGYVSTWITVKATWGLTTDETEMTALRAAITGC